jgi:hypothetical protein
MIQNEEAEMKITCRLSVQNTKAIIFLFLIACCFLPTSCKKNDPVSPPGPPVQKQQDTTSHNVVWQIHTFGDPGPSSWIRDVFAISDTDVWAVGSIQEKWGNPSNAAHWDGRGWTLMSLNVATSNPGEFSYQDLRSVFAFSRDDVWFFSGMSYVHWDGQKFTSKYILYFYGEIEKV